MDDRERDQFYQASSEESEKGDEYELEPPDPEVIAGELRRGQVTLESTRASVDLDEIYREAEHDRGGEILESWVRNFQFRFQTKHLLIATAVLAIVLTLAKLDLLGVVVVVGIMLSVAGVYLYLQWQDKKHQEEVNRRRQELYARRRAQLQQSPSGGPEPAAGATVAPRATAPPAVDTRSEIDEAWQAERARAGFQFRFSMQQMLAAMTAAALVFGLVNVVGGPTNAATLLGLIALLGLVAHALGYEPPDIVVLGWWSILVIYVVLSIVGAVWTSMT